MSLPKKEEKGYLQFDGNGAQLTLIARKDHAVELVPLFAQHGLEVRDGGEASGEENRLVFGRGVDRAKAQEILDAYKNAKGS
jgi:hypothetical protein